MLLLIRAGRRRRDEPALIAVPRTMSTSGTGWSRAAKRRYRHPDNWVPVFRDLGLTAFMRDAYLRISFGRGTGQASTAVSGKCSGRCVRRSSGPGGRRMSTNS